MEDGKNVFRLRLRLCSSLYPINERIRDFFLEYDRHTLRTSAPWGSELLEVFFFIVLYSKPTCAVLSLYYSARKFHYLRYHRIFFFFFKFSDNIEVAKYMHVLLEICDIFLLIFFPPLNLNIHFSLLIILLVEMCLGY